MRRALSVVTLAVVALLASAAPAAAHAGAVQATDYIARIRERPRLAGLTVRVVEAGGRLEVTSRRIEVVVLGFEGEPYLRIGPDGVHENRRSPAVYLNADRSGGVAPPPEADPAAEPRWVRVADGPTARWHDHRIHWMASDPPAVQDAPEEPHVVDRWALPIRTGDRELRATGDILYQPGPSTWPWVVVAGTLALLVVLASRLGRARRAVVAAAAVLLVADVGRVAGLVLIVAGDAGERLAQAIDVGLLPLVGWGIALAGVARLLRGHHDGRLAIGFAGLLLAIVGGLLEWGDLGRSQLAVAGPDDLGRLCTGVVAGTGLGLAATVLAAAYRGGTAVSPGGR